jgi:hypothetical protein
MPRCCLCPGLYGRLQVLNTELPDSLNLNDDYPGEFPAPSPPPPPTPHILASHSRTAPTSSPVTNNGPHGDASGSWYNALIPAPCAFSTDHDIGDGAAAPLSSSSPPPPRARYNEGEQATLTSRQRNESPLHAVYSDDDNDEDNDNENRTHRQLGPPRVVVVDGAPPDNAQRSVGAADDGASVPSVVFAGGGVRSLIVRYDATSLATYTDASIF